MSERASDARRLNSPRRSPSPTLDKMSRLVLVPFSPLRPEEDSSRDLVEASSSSAEDEGSGRIKRMEMSKPKLVITGSLAMSPNSPRRMLM